MLSPDFRKSTFSWTEANCLEARWRASSFCQGGECVETRTAAGTVQVRDSTGGPVLDFTREQWATFIAGIKGT